jgi:hypothetical protein
MSQEKVSIDKLNGENFASWKFQMQHYMKACGYHKIVTGEEKAPGSSASGEAKQAYERRCDKAFSTLVLAINGELIYLIRECQTVQDAWSKLVNHFE